MQRHGQSAAATNSAAVPVSPRIDGIFRHRFIEIRNTIVAQRNTKARERLKFTNMPAIAPALVAKTGCAAHSGTKVMSKA